jgi:hypothetical protein
VKESVCFTVVVSVWSKVRVLDGLRRKLPVFDSVTRVVFVRDPVKVGVATQVQVSDISKVLLPVPVTVPVADHDGLPVNLELDAVTVREELTDKDPLVDRVAVVVLLGLPLSERLCDADLVMVADQEWGTHPQILRSAAPAAHWHTHPVGAAPRTLTAFDMTPQSNLVLQTLHWVLTVILVAGVRIPL